MAQDTKGLYRLIRRSVDSVVWWPSPFVRLTCSWHKPLLLRRALVWHYWTYAAISCKTEMYNSELVLPDSNLNVSQYVCLGKHGKQIILPLGRHWRKDHHGLHLPVSIDEVGGSCEVSFSLWELTSACLPLSALSFLSKHFYMCSHSSSWLRNVFWLEVTLSN